MFDEKVIIVEPDQIQVLQLKYT